MGNIAIIVSLLLVPYWILALFPVPELLRGRIGITLVFAFTGMGHFIKAREMSQMIPEKVPMRLPLIYVSGVFELLAAVGILVPEISRQVGIILCCFLVLVFPSNIYAAIKRVDFGGHGMGPVYLLARAPLQILLLGWVYWFAAMAH
jgi:uncharacterized membrane protein